MKQILFILSFIFGIGNTFAIVPDILVTQTGESIKVYNLDITSGENVYYTLQDSENAPLQKILKSDVLIIKKADGTKIDPSNPVDKISESKRELESSQQVNPNAHKPITVKTIEPDFTEMEVKDFKSPQKFILIEDGYGNILNLRLLSESEKTLAVAKPRKGLKYDYEKILIPEHVNYKGDIYSIIQIDKKAFHYKGKDKIKNIIFPETLRIILDNAFDNCLKLNSIILPESIERIGHHAFQYCGFGCKEFKQVYIPVNIKEIGHGAFLWAGRKWSFNGFYQGYLSSIPQWITVGNCTNFGIDEESVEDYERRNGLRKD